MGAENFQENQIESWVYKELIKQIKLIALGRLPESPETLPPQIDCGLFYKITEKMTEATKNDDEKRERVRLITAESNIEPEKVDTNKIAIDLNQIKIGISPKDTIGGEGEVAAPIPPDKTFIGEIHTHYSGNPFSPGDLLCLLSDINGDKSRDLTSKVRFLGSGEIIMLLLKTQATPELETQEAIDMINASMKEIMRDEETPRAIKMQKELTKFCEKFNIAVYSGNFNKGSSILSKVSA